MLPGVFKIFADQYSDLIQNLLGEKRGRRKYKKSEYLVNEKSFLDEIKNIFHSFWRAII